MKMTGAARSLETGGTEVTSVSELNVIGILAQMGARVINEVSNVIFAQFVKNFQAQLQQPVNAPVSDAEPLRAASVAWAAAKNAFHRKSQDG